MITYSGSPTNHPSIDVPEGTDVVNIADVTAALEKLRDGAEFTRLNGNATVAAVNRCLPLMNAVIDTTIAAAPYWYFTNRVVIQGDTTGAAVLWLELDLPAGVTITQLLLTVDGNGGGANHSSLPATLPAVSLIIVNPNSGAAFTTDTQSDTSANLAAYEAAHFIQLDVTRVVAADRRHLIKIQGETGANSVAASLALFGLQISYDAVA